MNRQPRLALVLSFVVLCIVFFIPATVTAQSSATFDLVDTGGEIRTCPNPACPVIMTDGGAYPIVAQVVTDDGQTYYRLDFGGKGWVHESAGTVAGDLAGVSQFYVKPEAASYLGTLFADDFESEQALNRRWDWWFDGPTVVERVAETEVNHAMQIAAGADDWPNITPLVSESLRSGDYSWSAKVKIVQQQTQYDLMGDFDLRVRIDWDVNHLNASTSLSVWGGGLGYYDTEIGQYHGLTWQDRPMNIQTWYTVRIDAIGNNFYLYIDDGFVTSATKEGVLPYGSVNIGPTPNVTIQVDDAILRSLDATRSAGPTGTALAGVNMQASPVDGAVVSALSAGEQFYILDWTSEGDWVYIRKNVPASEINSTFQGWIPTDVISVN